MRKVLSFVLVLSLVLGSFSMAFAATPAPTGLSDITGIVNEEAIQVNYDLGIVTGNPDGTFLPEKTVNRAEFAAMITRALAIPDSALAGYSTTSFKDTAGYGWAVPYLAFCNSKGIMLGDGAGNAMPGRTINSNEAVTMALRAIGYTANSAELVGAWPSNYVTKAQDLGLYKDVAKVVNVDKANAAQIIYNTLTVQKVAVNSDGETKALWDGGTPQPAADPTNQVTLLNSGLKCFSKVGVMGSDFGDDALININKYLGQHGTAYLNEDDEVVAFISDSTKLVGSINADDEFNTTVEDVNYTTTGGVTAALTSVEKFVNGKNTATGFNVNDELVLNVKLSGKKIVEVYSAMDWVVTADSMISADELKDITEDQSLLGSDFVLDDDDEIDYDSFALVGAKSLSDIKADNVVYVYANADGIARIEVGTATAEGTVASFKNGTIPKFTIGGKTYKNAADMVNGVAANANGASIADTDVAEDVTAYLDVNGYVYDFEYTSGGNKNIAVVQKYASGMNDEVKIFTSAGKSEVHTFDSAKLVSNAAIKNTVIAYSLNKDGKITDSRMDEVSGAALKFKSNSVVTVDGADKVIASDVVVFAQEDDGDLLVTSIDKVEKNTTSTFAGSVLYSADDKKVVGILVPASQAKASSDDVYAVVNELYVDNYDGDKVDRIVGFADGKAIDKKADGKYLTYAAPVYTTDPALFANSVNLYKIEMDADGIITNISAPVATSGKIEVVSGVALTGADGRNSVTFTSGGAFIAPLAKNVLVYEVNSDGDYKVYTGGFKDKDVVVLYELDDDADGYDLVILNRADR